MRFSEISTHCSQFCSDWFSLQVGTVRRNEPEKEEARKRDRCGNREKTRWLQVCRLCICVLIDVIILVVNSRLRDKPVKHGERKGRGRVQEQRGA